MTLDNAYEILSILKVAYPHSFKNISDTDVDATANLWQRMFSSESYEQVEAAVYMLISSRTEVFSPTIGEIKEKLLSLQAVTELGEAEAWALVSKACSNGIYSYRQEFDKLPAVVKRVVGQPEQLKEWAMMDADTVQSVVASNFMRSYRAKTARDKELAIIPDDIKRLITGISEPMKLDVKSTARPQEAKS